MTVLGALLLLIGGAVSIPHKTTFIVYAGKVGFITGTDAGNLLLGAIHFPDSLREKRFAWIFEYHHQPGVHDWFPLPEVSNEPNTFIPFIPFWLLALIFVLIQYLLLPKSLPPPEEESSGE